MRGDRQTLRLQRAALAAGDRVLLVRLDRDRQPGGWGAGARCVDQLPPGRRELLLRVHTLLPKALLGDDR